MDSFYHAETIEDKASVIDKYARKHLDMTADVDIQDDDHKYFPPYPESPLARTFCECTNESKDIILLAQDCMCHFCNKF